MELLIVITITGILFAALLAGLAAMIKSSALHRRQADVGAVVRTAAEKVKLTGYQPCAGALAAYQGALNLLPAVSNVSTPTVDVVTSIDGGACTDSTRLQRIQVTATSQDGRTSETLWVVNRDAS